MHSKPEFGMRINSKTIRRVVFIEKNVQNLSFKVKHLSTFNNLTTTDGLVATMQFVNSDSTKMSINSRFQEDFT